MGAAKQANEAIPPQIKQQIDRFRGARPMSTFDSEVQQVESIRADKTQITDPVLVKFQTPKTLGQKTWKETATYYHGIALGYAAKNNRHIDELDAQAKTHKRWSIDQLERSTGEYERLQNQIKHRDAMIDQLKDTIHLLTKKGF